MQIDRRPNRGPYVAALICLLTLCLTVPIFWPSHRARVQLSERSGADRRESVGGAGDLLRVVRYPDPTAGLSDFGPVDTLDEVLKQYASRRAHGANLEPDLFTELIAGPGASRSDPSPQPEGVVWQYLTSGFHRTGRVVAGLSSGDGLDSLAAQLASSREARRQRFDRVPTRSLLLVGPNDRLAMAGPHNQQPPAADVGEIPAPWCTPTALVERLEVLAGHPYCADWAQEAIAEVRALTETDRPSTSAVAAQLVHLQSLATEAVRLADATDEGCLRAELLRAHWGLARRLECWSLMRDIVVASLTENRFAARVPWDASHSVLSGQGTETTDLRALSAELEQYEQNSTPRLARAIVERQRLLTASNDARQQELASQLEKNYRNANVRLAISAEMLERFVAQQHEEISPVRDRIAGTPVRGQSTTRADNKVRLEPDASRWNMDLTSTGTVDSQTVADAGAVKLNSCGTTDFTAEKSIIVDPHGVQLGSSTADARNFSQLMGIRSSYDWIPAVNDLVRTRAIDEYRRKRPLAQAEVEYKVARRIEQQLDDRASAAVSKFETQLRDQVSAPLKAAGVDVTPIEMSTTAERIIARLRVAGGEQLAAHTPRPRAPSDSLASVQVHESALTNAAAGLELDGKRLTSLELQTLIREKLAHSNDSAPPVVEEAVFAFAPRDAIRFRVADEKLELVLSLQEVVHDRESVRNFRVHVFYRPDVHGLEAEFVRDGALGVEGRIGSGERARMHGVFNKVFTEERRLPIVRMASANDPRLEGLMITQLVLEDGWIGLAVGPGFEQRTAELSRTLR